MGLILDIYRNGRMDCTNGGISGPAARHLVAVNIDGPFTPGPDAPAVLVVTGNVRGSVKIVAAVNVGTDDDPCWIEDKPDGAVGPMMGGNYADGDSRLNDLVEKLTGIRAYGAIPIHDRYETPAEYERLSR
jgi:hypothetical protein